MHAGGTIAFAAGARKRANRRAACGLGGALVQQADCGSASGNRPPGSETRNRTVDLTTAIHDVAIARLGEPSIPSPLRLVHGHGHGLCVFVPEAARVREGGELTLGAAGGEEFVFEKAGPRERLFFDPSRTRAAVVTCGGLCPGLNDVIRSLFLELHYNYRVPELLGIRYGYQGLNPSVGLPPISITRECVANIHNEGGTFLGSSRGEQDVGVMVDTLARLDVHCLFCVGGDGTQRGAHAIVQEVKRRGLHIAVVGIPKTIDNDILYCDRTFGLVTAVEKAAEVLHLAHTEAKGAPRCIGLVKVMGRHAGFIACLATIACQDVNVCLIPELPFALDGPEGLLAALERRMDARGHAVICVAEGAGQNLFAGEETHLDASGNVKLHDIGPHLKERIAGHFKRRKRPVDIKYIDPSYIIRSAPANTDDSLLCDQLARNAAHAALAGKTDVLMCHKNGKFLHVPISMAVARKQQVDVEGPLWAAVLASTGQPVRFA